MSRSNRLAVVVALVLAVGGVMAVAFAASPPPTPKITSSPTNPTISATPVSAHFTYSDTQAGVTFKCSLDSPTFTVCPTAGFTSAPLAQGNHTFQVEAVSGSGTSTPKAYLWAIVPLAPTIGTGPTNPTGATTATFTFSEPSQPSVGFKCALDGGSFTACTSGKTYTGLGGGNHTFQVEAQVGTNPPSAAVSFGWTIDLTAPTITLTFPTNGGAYNNAGWLAGCTPTAGICGSAADPAGVASVGVALRQQSSGKYWNGSTFGSNSIVFNTVLLGTPNGTSTTWKYAKTLPADGQYTVSVRATDGFGNTTANSNLTTATFTIDTIAPPATTITNKPSNPSTVKNPEFEFTNTDAQATFTCKLDSGTPTPCAGDSDHDGDGDSGDGGGRNSGPTFGEMQYNNLTPGNHCFSVYATDTAGNAGPTTTYCWTISGTTTNTIAVFSGTPQTATAGGTFAAPLKAIVKNASNVGVPGVTVTFTAPGSGASATFAGGVNTAVTDASGVATSVVVSANTTVGGPYNVTATAPSVSGSPVFSLRNLASVPFQVSGSAPLSFYPGLLQPLDPSVTNPNASDLIIPIGGIHISVTTSDQANCPALGGVRPNFTVTSNLVPITVPANTTSPVTLSHLGIAAGNRPTVKMNNTTDNQNACKHLSITLDYSGSTGGQP